MMNKKGIIEMMETFMVLFVVFILIGIGMFFFFKASIESGKESHTELCEKHATELLTSIINLPDITCTREASSCIDTAKLVSFKKAMDTGGRERRQMLETGACQKAIAIEQAYPEPAGNAKNQNCTLQLMNSPEFPQNCGKWNIFEPKSLKKAWKSARKIETPVTLYYPAKDEYGIGRVIITLYTST